MFEGTQWHNRFGKVVVAVGLLSEWPNIATLLFERAIVVRAEMLAYADAVEYVMAHPDFEPQVPGSMLPLYDAVFTQEDTDDGSILTFHGFKKHE